MTGFQLQVYADDEEFKEDWKALGYNETEAEQYWTLLGELESGELLIHLPEWLADEKIGFVDGATPTAFVGRIDTESEKAVQFTESAAGRPLSQLASRIQSLEDSIIRLQGEDDVDSDRIEWLQSRLNEKRNAFESRDDVASLTDEWLPKSQIEFIGRRAPTQ